MRGGVERRGDTTKKPNRPYARAALRAHPAQTSRLSSSPTAIFCIPTPILRSPSRSLSSRVRFRAGDMRMLSESVDELALGTPYGAPPPPLPLPTLETEPDAAREAVGVGSPSEESALVAFVGVWEALVVRKSSHDVGSFVFGTGDTERRR